MDAPSTRPYASWIVERGAPSLVHRGETIGECDRTLRSHRSGVIAKGGVVVSVKGKDAPSLKLLMKAVADDWRSRPSEPEAPALPEGVDLGPPKVRSKRRTEEHASEPVPPPPLVEEPIEIDVPVTRREPEDPASKSASKLTSKPEATTAATETGEGAEVCSRCNRRPVAGTSYKTRPKERTWCARCRKAGCEERLKALRAQDAHTKRLQRRRKPVARAVRTTEPTSPLAASLDRWEALGAELEELQELVRLGRAVREVTRG